MSDLAQTDPDSESQPPGRPGELNRLDVLRGLRISTWEGASSTIHGTFTSGAFLTGFALWLGADSFAIGLLTAIPTFAGLVQIAASYASEKLTERKPFTAWFSVAGRMLWLPILILPILMGHGRALIPFLVLFTLSAVLQNIPAPAWMSWMSDLVPPDHRGRYFGRRNMVAGIVGMVVALPAAWFLDYATKRHHFEGMGFGILFGIAVASGLVSLGLILRQPEPRRPPAPNAGRSEGLQGLLTYYRLPFTDKNFVRLMLFNCMLGLGQNFAAPFFTVYALQVLKLDYTWLQIFSTIASVSSLASMPLFGYLSDKVGSKPLLAISVIGVFTTPISWMLTVPNHFALTAAILSEMNIVSGMFWACAGLMQFNLLIASAPPERTTVYAATMAATTGLVGGIAPLLGGVMMHMLSGWHATFLHIHMTAFHVTFFVASLLRLAALAFFGSISEPHSSSARDVIQQLTRANPRAWMHLRKLQEGSLEDRLRATEALGESRTVLATGELTVALTDPSHDVRAEAARALGEIGDPRTVRALMSALEDPAPEVTEEAIRALARIGDREANAPLIALLCDTARAVPRRIRIAAADALGSLGGSDAADALMDLLRRIDDEETGEVVVRALGGIGDHRAVPHLVEILTRQSTPRGMRLAIVRTLGEIADEAAVPALRTVLAADDVDAGLLPPLADAFARLKDVPSLPRLIDCLTYLPSTVARRQVAHAIGVIAGHGEGIYALLAKEEMARDTALTRMVGDMRKQLKGPGARRSLQAALQAYTEGSYALCLRALGRVYQPIMQARAESPRPIDEPTRTVLTSLFQTRPAAPPLEAVLLAFAVMNDVLDEGEMGV